ncbi:MAG: TfoX/Sxy family protein [Methyloceanibacter sp.]
MAVTGGFKDLVRDLLADFGPVTIRNMFGGAGIYADGVMFAILDDDVLYLKADETSARAFTEEGMEPFTYVMEGKGPVAMSYYEVPPRLLESPEELASWAREAHRIACAKKTRSKKRKGAPSR